MSKSKAIPSFEVDHTTLKAGLYLRKVKRVGLFGKVNVWDMQFIAPAEKRYMSIFTMHTIEHIFKVKLKEYLEDSYIQSAPMGSGTGFSLVTKGISEKKLRYAIVEAIEDVVPLVEKSEIPALNEKQCSRPGSYSLRPATDELWGYRNILLGSDEEL